MGEDWTKLTRRYEQSFWEDMKSLGVMTPTVKTKVTQHVPDIISFIQSIIDNGFAYPTAGG